MIILLILLINLQIIKTLEVPYYFNPKIHNLGNIVNVPRLSKIRKMKLESVRYV